MVSGTIRVLLVLSALSGAGGCIIGPQDDIPVTPQGARDDGEIGASGGDGDDFADGDADADADNGAPDPDAGLGDEGLPDDGAFEAGGGEAEDPDGLYGDEIVPKHVTIPQPGPPPPVHRSSDYGYERSDDPAPPSPDTTDGSDS